MANQCLIWLDKLHTHTIGNAMVPHFTHSKNKIFTTAYKALYLFIYYISFFEMSVFSY